MSTHYHCMGTCTTAHTYHTVLTMAMHCSGFSGLIIIFIKRPTI